MKERVGELRKHFFGAFMVLLMISIILASHSLYVNKQPKFPLASPDELIPSIIQNRSIRISDLVREDIVIRKKTFDNCHIYGPAVIHLESGLVTHNDFAEISKDALFLEIEQEKIYGIIIFEDCIITKCTFHKISIIGTKKDLAHIRSGFTF